MNKLLEAPCDQAAGNSDGAGTNPPHRILVVEDDRELRQINAMVLTHAGYTVDMAPPPSESLKRGGASVNLSGRKNGNGWMPPFPERPCAYQLSESQTNGFRARPGGSCD